MCAGLPILNCVVNIITVKITKMRNGDVTFQKAQQNIHPSMVEVVVGQRRGGGHVKVRKMENSEKMEEILGATYTQIHTLKFERAHTVYQRLIYIRELVCAKSLQA